MKSTLTGNVVKAKEGRKISVTKTGDVDISPYNVNVNYDDVIRDMIKGSLGVKEYDQSLKFYGRVTIIIEELIIDEDIVNTFGKIPDAVEEEVESE